MFKLVWYKMRERSASPYHLLLDTGALSTTNVKMKKLHIITGLLIIGLLAQSGLAKSKSRNGRTQRQAYLPPRAPSRPTITEEYITIHEEAPGSGQSQFQESNYGGGKYEIFEIHSHYEPSAGRSGGASYSAPSYLPPQQEIRVEHVHQSGNGVSFSNHGGSRQHIAPISPAPAPVSPAVPFPSSFQHGFSNSQSESVSTGGGASYAAPVKEEVIRVEHFHVSQLQNSQHATGFKAPDYLPPAPNPHHSVPQSVPEYRAPDYLPPLQHNHEHHAHSRPTAIQSVSHQQQLNSFAQQQGSGYLPPQTEHQNNHHEIQRPSQFRAPDYLPPHQEHHQHVEQQQHISHSNQFRGPDYLPPHQSPAQHNEVQYQQSGYKGPDYLPPHQHNQHHEDHQQVQHQQAAFKGPDYLPPHREEQTHHQQVEHQTTSFKGPDYLPPHQAHAQHNQHHEGHQQVQHQQGAFKGPDYLPPHQEQQSHHHEAHQQVQQQPTSFKGPDYLPPHQHNQHHEAHQQVQHQQNTFKGPDYLPPHQNNQHHEAHQQVQNQQSAFKGPDYLPPHQEQHSQHHEVHQHQTNSFKGPDYLPPHQQSHHHEVQHQQAAFKGPDYLPPHHERHQAGSLPNGYEPQIPAVPLPPQQQAFQPILPQPAPPLQTSSNLPPGYDFERPENAEEAIAELHTLPEEHAGQQEVVVQSQIQVEQGPQQADIIYGSHQSGVNYQANGYLPPHQSTNNYQVQQANVQTLTSSAGAQQNVQQYQRGLQQVAPQTFTPSPAAPITQAPASNYLPPATPVQAQQYSSNLHSLSSYMTSVDPFQRYASAPRQPFREYGPPPAAPNHAAFAQPQQQQQQHYQQPQPLPVAPMYREPASRPPHYAPAMSYATNAVANSYAVHNTASQHQHVSFNQQTRQNLQQFMPSNVPRPIPVAAPAVAPAPQPAAIHSAPAVPVRQSTSSKIRTVQILNPSAVKTLKVLETSDHTGVKTIKILGHSNTQPSGEHQIIKVVSQNAPNAHEHVQTVKIFNDHEAVPSHGGAGANAYLPPNVRVLRQTPLKLQLLPSEKYRRPFTGRPRYRV